MRRRLVLLAAVVLAVAACTAIVAVPPDAVPPDRVAGIVATGRSQAASRIGLTALLPRRFAAARCSVDGRQVILEYASVVDVAYVVADSGLPDGEIDVFAGASPGEIADLEARVAFGPCP